MLEFRAHGKEVLACVAGQRPQRVADACDERAALWIAKALNIAECEPLDFLG